MDHRSNSQLLGVLGSLGTFPPKLSLVLQRSSPQCNTTVPRAKPTHHPKRHLDQFGRFCMSPKCYAVQCIVNGEENPTKLLLPLGISSTHRRRTEPRPQVTCRKKLVKIARVVSEISSRTDRQTDRHTDVFITILRHRSRFS